MARDRAFRRFKEFMRKLWAKKIIIMRTKDIPYYEITCKEIGRVAHTPHACSCDMCGNPRHHKCSKKDQLTIQEKKENDRFKYHDETYIDSDDMY